MTDLTYNLKFKIQNPKRKTIYIMQYLGAIGTGGPAYSPEASMGYMMDGSQQFRPPPGVVDGSGMGISPHAMSSAMSAYSSQQLGQMGRSPVHSAQQAMGLIPGHHPGMMSHAMGGHPALPPPQEPYY